MYLYLLTCASSLRLENAVCPWNWHNAPNVVLRSERKTTKLWRVFIELRIWNDRVFEDSHITVVEILEGLTNVVCVSKAGADGYEWA